ncbi:MAG: hypothetical protein LKJ44_03180 [Bifidobacteriaceae bacterium]|jgi:type II secretory pathway pseudopilin PulG|nr:hypothetical protein [Bifidobacteriaceae bacterium]MCI1978704.1 hypothetical protein [Bifidobacteriaceae bacterium]
MRKKKRKKGITILRVVVAVFLVAVVAALIYVFVAFRGVANDLNAASGDIASQNAVALVRGADASRGRATR